MLKSMERKMSNYEQFSNEKFLHLRFFLKLFEIVRNFARKIIFKIDC